MSLTTELIAERDELRARIAELEGVVEDVCDRILGPTAPTCDGCSVEMAEALKELRALLERGDAECEMCKTKTLLVEVGELKICQPCVDYSQEVAAPPAEPAPSWEEVREVLEEADAWLRGHREAYGKKRQSEVKRSIAALLSRIPAAEGGE